MNSKGKFKSSNIQVENQLEGKIEVSNNLLKMKVEYQSESQTANSSTAVKAKMRMFFWEVFSFVPTSNNGYNGEEKTVLYVIGKNSTLQNFDSSSNACKKDSNGVYNAKVVGSLGSNGTITFSFHFSGSNFVSGSQTVPNNAVKFGIKIENFPFPTGTDVQQIGVRMAVLSGNSIGQKVKVKVEGQTQDAVVTDVSKNKAWFAWDSTALDQNGNNVTIATSQVTTVQFNSSDVEIGEVSNQIYFTFLSNRSSSLNWDPQVGISTTPSSSTSSSSVLALSFVLSCLLSFFLF